MLKRCHISAKNDQRQTSADGKESVAYVCFVDYQKAFDRVKHDKLLEVMEKAGSHCSLALSFLFFFGLVSRIMVGTVLSINCPYHISGGN